MSFEFRRGERETTSVLLALAGASGSGKTYTAILLGLGLAYPGMNPDEIMAAVEREGRARIVVIDTEGGRALHYAPKPGNRPDFVASFPFEYAEIKPPFTPQAYQDAVVGANDAGFAVVIVDSMSHEYESEGGILEWADRLAEGVPKPDVKNPEAWKNEHWLVKPVKSPGNWKEPKRAHKVMVNRFLQCRAHLIFCLRAEEKMQLVQEKVERNGREFTNVKVIPAADRPVNERWEPICEKRFMYEMTASFVLLPSNPGVGIPLKLQEQHQPCFPDGERMGVQSGWGLANWASGTTTPAAAASPPPAKGQPDKPAQGGPDAAAEWAAKYLQRVAECTHVDALIELQDKSQKNLTGIRGNRPDLWAEILAAHTAAHERLGAQG